MKHLPLQNPAYQHLLLAFQHWLTLLNYAPQTIHNSPIKLQEFFHWLETRHITSIREVTHKTIHAYFAYLQSRPSRRRPGGLTLNGLKSHLVVLRCFARYLRETEQESFEVDIRLSRTVTQAKVILSREEVQQLYQSTTSDMLGLRDKAMLSIYYGCGLRRSEGVALDVGDLLLNKGLLLVRKGKNYQERYVPISERVQEHLQDYLAYARPMLLKAPRPALLLTVTGQRLEGYMMTERLKVLRLKAALHKPATLHSLRHSIATHLLQSGMSLEHIRRFLGHRSLVSTQIYTHTAHESRSL